MGRLVDRVMAVAAARPAAPAVEDARAQLTYHDLARRITLRRDELAVRYTAGSRILILLGNSTELPIWTLAASAAGLLPILADPRGLGANVEPLIAAFGPRLLVTARLDERLGGSERSILVGDSVVLTEYSNPTTTRLTGAFAAIATSGTTGRPKAVVLSDAAWVESARRLQEVLDIGASDRALHVASLAHGSGLMFAAVLLAGGANVISPRFVAREFVRDAAMARATVTFIVPTMLYDLLEIPEFRPDRLPDLRTVYYSGGPASASLVGKAASRWGPRLVQDYGLIEAPAPQLVLGRHEHALLKEQPLSALAKSCGLPLYPEEVGIGPATDMAGVGQITVRGPTLMSGYLTADGVDASPISSGVFATGDLAVRDESGYFRIVGRMSNVIATGGRKVNAEHVERVLRDCPHVRDVAVAGIPDDRWGEMLAAIVVPAGPGSKQAIGDYARQHLAPHERPKVVYSVAEVPRGATGKIRRDDLRSLVAALHASSRVAE